MLKIAEVLSRSMRVTLFSTLLGLSWLYQSELNEFLGLSFEPWINRALQLSLVCIIALVVGTPANWLFSRIHDHLEQRSFNDLPPGP
ncbi:hypothetical protein V4Z64_005016 [Pseudomonas aeruginosa]|uniref:hypothetical protein n=1 Tax=Pseudomonas aeruginosa TaxID=287 RepID=UPI0015F0E63E|nr:hypothetical protein [Pseudomonas aeruginosa]MBA5106060.1 hypothetical protein [Pseudomonas aeruginosa]MDP5989995.1 hypothetical protein [Pseudomonas aeruginosa]HCE9175713.1 hypothetical protein [Pseudomonas aeruginosa]HEJ9771300.1 hypothetical protein [Pseudomonas aeruginosa]HEO1611750.1 hypothetical protein [Pseudomonas aeruginosa]